MNGVPTLIASVGLPRSGKSTILSNLSRILGAPIVSKDCIRLALHGRPYEVLAEQMIRAVSGLMIRSLFLAGHQVVICDETNYSRAARDFLRDDSKWQTKFLEVKTSAETCIERAKATNQEYLIPVIKEMLERYEPLKDDEERYLIETKNPDL